MRNEKVHLHHHHHHQTSLRLPSRRAIDQNLAHFYVATPSHVTLFVEASVSKTAAATIQILMVCALTARACRMGLRSLQLRFARLLGHDV